MMRSYSIGQCLNDVVFYKVEAFWCVTRSHAKCADQSGLLRLNCWFLYQPSMIFCSKCGTECLAEGMVVQL